MTGSVRPAAGRHTGVIWGAASLLVATALLLGAAVPALARSERLRWQHPAPAGVASFSVHVGPSSGRYTQRIDVGLPAAQNGIYVYDLTVPDADDVYVAVTAVDAAGQRSVPSNEQLRSAPALPPPPPPAPLGAPGQPVVQP
jgi:hypothetical protein